MADQSGNRSIASRLNDPSSSRNIFRFLQAAKEKELPNQVMQSIFSMLPMTYVFLCKLVCQGWRKSFHEPKNEMARLHFLHSRNNPRTTSLLLYSAVRSKSTGVEDISVHVIPYADKCDHAFELTKLQFKSFLPKFKIMGSCHGLVCVADDTATYRSIMIFNPVTGDWHLCPESNLGRRLGTVVKGKFFGFGYDPILRLYKVVRIRELVSGDGTVDMAVEMHILGDDCWKTFKIPKQYKMLMSGSRGSLSHGVFGLGVFLWLYITKNNSVMYIGAFYSEGEGKFRAYILPQPIKGRNCHQVYLGELDGLMSVAYDGNPEKYMDVWQMQKDGCWSIGYKIRKPDPCTSCKAIARIQLLGIDMNGNILFSNAGCVHKGFYSYNPKSDTLFVFETTGLPSCYSVFPLTPTFLPLKEAIYIHVTEGLDRRKSSDENVQIAINRLLES